MADIYDRPFIFGVKVEGDNFTDRVEETKTLLTNFTYGVNTIIISPRRMGKTSLVEKVRTLVDNSKIKVAHIDAFGLRCEIDFVNALATAVVKATSTRWEEWMENAKVFLSRFVPKISLGQDPLNDFSISLEYNPANNTTEEVLQLPELIAKSKGYRIVVCIDEFQQIGEFSDSLTFQKKLRSVWQLQQNVSYCMYGSKKHMMEKIFLNKSYPFYRFGDIIYLGKISEDDWVKYIQERFSATGKTIEEDIAREICQLTERYSSYVQQLAWFVWLRCDMEVVHSDLEFAVNRLLDSQEALFIQQTESLSDYQMNFLRAIAEGVRTGFAKKAILDKYRLGTSANIVRLKNALIEKDLIETIAPQTVEMSDPILKLWLKRRVWR
ncbi:MAG: ATP-binding protein [Prevotellaceae bacterium]|nr:ATP-binding protein [Candidatus Minthosoma caballi]